MQLQPPGNDIVLVLGVDHHLGKCQRLGVEVDVMPTGQGDAPVEDDGLENVHTCNRMTAGAANGPLTSQTTWYTMFRD